MNRLVIRMILMLVTSVALQFAQQPIVGIPPRAKSDDYAVKARVENAVFAASLVPAKEVRRIFAFDISGSYVVFEVACYPDTSATRQMLREDFALKGRTQGDLTHQVEAETVAAAMQQRNLPRAPSRQPDVVVATTVGYESGVDPATGRRIHGVYTDTGVGVGMGNDRAPGYPTPGGLPEDRELLQAQLRARSLPEGKIDHPVAGYLFFSRSGSKAQADGKYALAYLIDATSTSSAKEVLLSVPGKAH